MKTALLLLSLLISGHALASEPAPARYYAGVAAAPANPAEQEIAALFDKWNRALATGSADKVASLYAPNAILQPTVSNQVRTTPAEIRDYFVHFLAARPQGTINYRQIHRLDKDNAFDSGVYTFILQSGGKPKQVQARYTYIYQKINKEWKIVNHHSSAMPEVVVHAVVAKSS